MTASWADTPTDNFFDSIDGQNGSNGIHSTSYAHDAMRSGYGQSAVLQFGANETGTGYWLGTLYPDSEHASAAVTQVEKDLSATAQEVGASCGSHWPSNCQNFVFDWTDTTGVDHTTSYTVFSEANVVGETAVDSSFDSAQASTAEWNRDAQAISRAGQQAVAAAIADAAPPTITSFGAYVSSKRGGPPVAKVQLLRKFYVDVKFQLSRPGTYHASGNVKIANGHIQIQKKLSAPKGKMLLFADMKLKNAKWKGSVTALVSVKVNNSTKHGAFSFRVVPFKK